MLQRELVGKKTGSLLENIQFRTRDKHSEDSLGKLNISFSLFFFFKRKVLFFYESQWAPSCGFVKDFSFKENSFLAVRKPFLFK